MEDKGRVRKRSGEKNKEKSTSEEKEEHQDDKHGTPFFRKFQWRRSYTVLVVIIAVLVLFSIGYHSQKNKGQELDQNRSPKVTPVAKSKNTGQKLDRNRSPKVTPVTKSKNTEQELDRNRSPKVTPVAKSKNTRRESVPNWAPEFKPVANMVLGFPHDDEIRAMSKKQLFKLYHSYLSVADFLCFDQLRFGNFGDEGWKVCNDAEYRPKKPCVVYSFGIENDFSFEIDIEKYYGCKVFCFDPRLSMEQTSHNRTDKLRFFKIGLGHSNGRVPPELAHLTGEWELKTLTSIKAMLGHEDVVIDILKVDIEYSEWTALDDMVEREELDNVRQLLIEFHANEDAPVKRVRERVLSLTHIENIGFRRFYSHLNRLGFKILKKRQNNSRTSAYELCFINTSQRHYNQ